MSYFCPGCGWNVCRCPDWRELERQRIASGAPVRYVNWECTHGTRGVNTGSSQKSHLPNANSRQFFGKVIERNPNRLDWFAPRRVGHYATKKGA